MHENCKFFIVSLIVVYISTAEFAVLVALEFALHGNYFNIFKGFSTMTPDTISKKDFIHCDNKRVKSPGFRNISGESIKFNCPLLILQPSFEFFMIPKLWWGRLFLENRNGIRRCMKIANVLSLASSQYILIGIFLANQPIQHKRNKPQEPMIVSTVAGCNKKKICDKFDTVQVFFNQ